MPVSQHNSDWSKSNSVTGGSNQSSPTNEAEDDVIDIGQNDNLQSVLERLALSDFLSNFQVRFTASCFFIKNISD